MYLNFFFKTQLSLFYVKYILLLLSAFIVSSLLAYRCLLQFVWSIDSTRLQ